MDPAWEERLDALEQGEDVEIPYTDMAERPSLAQALGRRMASRKFKVELRYPRAEQLILVRKSPEPYVQKAQGG